MAVKSILATAKESGGLLMIVKMIEASGLSDILDGEDEYTLFAPTDRAMNNLPPGVVDELMEDEETLKSIMMYHLVKGRWLIENIIPQSSLLSLEGEPLTIGSSAYGALVNDSKIVTPDIECSNGTIQVIDRALFPCIVKATSGV